jgi:hypothetical protein
MTQQDESTQPESAETTPTQVVSVGIEKNHEPRLSPWGRDGVWLTCTPTKKNSNI